MTEDTSAVWVDPEEHARFRDAVVGDLRIAQIAHPADPELDDLIRDLKSASAEFSGLWRTATPTFYRGARKTFTHPVWIRSPSSETFFMPPARMCGSSSTRRRPDPRRRRD
ncbi:hypothetical protein [Williamsia herbipolensis]|uniref:MmyB family transcriptional regulator n=1 Tax=Williamsia herbipolensis TaxID=1603258 RepID=UPI003B84B242